MTNESATVAEDAATTDDAVETATDAHAEATSGWLARNNHGQTNFDRYVTPLLIPLVAVAGIIFYVINLSRVLISGTSTISLVVATVVTVLILAAAAALAAASKMRTQTITVFTCMSLLAVMLAGTIAVGHAQEEKEEAVVACEPIAGNLTVPTTAALKFDPEYKAAAGCVEINFTGPPGLHNLTFFGPGAPKGPVLLSSVGGKDKFAFQLEPGEYEFKCTVPGHEAMKSKLVVE